MVQTTAMHRTWRQATPKDLVQRGFACNSPKESRLILLAFCKKEVLCTSCRSRTLQTKGQEPDCGLTVGAYALDLGVVLTSCSLERCSIKPNMRVHEAVYRA